MKHPCMWSGSHVMLRARMQFSTAMLSHMRQCQILFWRASFNSNIE